MSERYISLYGDKAEKFEDTKQEFGPDGVDVSNADVVMRLIEFYEDHTEDDADAVPGGLVE